MDAVTHMKITLTDDAGLEHDVTEAVQIVYDALHASLDFGSGFLDAGEHRAMYLLATAGGWEPPEHSDDPCTCGHGRYWHKGGGCRSGHDCPCRAFVLNL